MSGKLVLVTGITGFIAGHVAEQFLEAGYHVRGTARSAKVQKLRETVKVPGLEFVQVDDIAAGDFTEALKDVDALIHVASPLPGKASPDDTINAAVEGTLNVLRQAAAAGIKKIVVTGSAGDILHPSLRPGFAGITLTEKDWSPASREDVNAQVAAGAASPSYVYFSSKALGERALWEFAKEHPDLDIAAILPVFVYGPYAKNFPVPASEDDLGTNAFPFKLATGRVPPTLPPWVADVRDVAKAHVLALNVPKDASTSPEGKRFLVHGGNLTWREAAAHLKKTRPEIKVLDIEAIPALPGSPSFIDTTKTQEVLGIKFTDPAKTVEDTAVALLALGIEPKAA